MDPERWQQIDKLVEQALEQESSVRADFIDEACAGDDELRREVESLLAAHGQASSFIEAPALEVSAKELAGDRPRLLTGQQLGPFKIVSFLGAGGMGVVYKAQDSRLRRPVAIKVLSAESVADADRKRRFVQEARAASGLNHPNIVTIYDIGQAEGVDFIAMEYVDGKTLDRLIPRKGMRVVETLRYTIQIADALAAAHTAGIIHRDLKPGNIMVTEKGQVKVLDFGLAKLTERTRNSELELAETLQAPSQSLSEEGMILGTVAYMSPEQAEGKKLDSRSDIFSFGSLLYEMLTGQRPFQGDSKVSTLSDILNKYPQAASEIRSEIPRDLEKIITRCLRKEPERRFQHMGDVKVGLEEVKEELASSSTRVAAAAGAGTKPKNKLAFVGVGILTLVVVIGTAVSLWHRYQNTEQPESSFSPVPLTTYPGSEYSPSFSPDGSQVAFVWSKMGNDNDADIYVKQIGVEEPFQFTDNPAPDISPSWSPDGHSIAFARWITKQRLAYIVKPQRGGPERTVVEFEMTPFGKFPRSMCDWMPDSKSLIVVGKNEPAEPDALLMVSLETGERRKLTNPRPGFADSSPAVSADGKTLVFTRSRLEYESDLYQLSLSENMQPPGEPKRLTFANPWNGCAAWIARELEIVFLSGNGDEVLNLCRMSLSVPAKVQTLASLGNWVGSASVSREANRLAYSIFHGGSNIWRVEVQEGKPKEAVKFSSSNRPEMEPAYSPDGKKVAFASRRSGPLEIWVSNSDGSQPIQLTSLNSTSNRPRWSPDGELITFNSIPKGNRNIYVIPAGGGVLRQLTNDSSPNSNPEWSIDGKWIYFSSDRTGQKEIWKVPVGGGVAVRVPQIQSGDSGQAKESPDGKFLYYEKGWPDHYSFWRVPINGGKESLVVDSLHPEGGQVIVDQGIYFISKPDEKGISHILFKDFTTGSVRTIAPIQGRVFWGLAVSPDRQSFLYTHYDVVGSDLMLVENFR